MTGIRSVMTASILAAALSAFVMPAQATLIGDTITATGYSLTPGSATIGAGVEFTAFGNNVQFDFGANTLTIDNGHLNNWIGFGNYVFAGFDDMITSVSIGSNTGISGTVVDNFSFGPHSITLDMNSGHANNNSVLVFNITEASATVPEPATAMLVGLGLFGLACTRRRRT